MNNQNELNFSSSDMAIQYLSELTRKRIKISKMQEKTEEEIDKISKNPEESYFYALDLIELDKDVPKKISEGISKSARRSYYHALDLLEVGKSKEIPTYIDKAISKEPTEAYQYIQELKKNIKG